MNKTKSILVCLAVIGVVFVGLKLTKQTPQATQAKSLTVPGIDPMVYCFRMLTSDRFLNKRTSQIARGISFDEKTMCPFPFRTIFDI